MPRLILHVGSHKTGTTALQNSLLAASASLAECGICYAPGLGFASSKADATAHHALAGLIAQTPSARTHVALKGARAFIEDQLDSGRDVLISSERFYRMKSANEGKAADARGLFLEAAARFFSGLPVEIVCYFRRPDTFIESQYREWAVKPFHRSFEACISTHSALSYGRRLGEFEDHFERVACFCFEDSVAHGLVEGFLRRHGLCDDALPEVKMRRTGISFRAASWLNARKANGKIARPTIETMWFFALDMRDHPLLKDARNERPWASEQEREAFFRTMLEGFRYASFWQEPAGPILTVAHDQADLDAIDMLYEVWRTRNAARIEARRKARTRPYAADPETSGLSTLMERAANWIKHGVPSRSP